MKEYVGQFISAKFRADDQLGHLRVDNYEQLYAEFFIIYLDVWSSLRQKLIAFLI